MDIYNFFCWKAWIFSIYYFSFRAKSTMWLWNILDLCREREFSSLTFPWISMISSGNYNYLWNITVRNQEPLLSWKVRKIYIKIFGLHQQECPTLHLIKSHTLIIGEYCDFWNISQRTFVIHILPLVFLLYFPLSWLFMLGNNLNKWRLLFGIKQVMKNIFIVFKCHLIVGWVVRRSRKVIIAIYLPHLVHIWLHLLLGPLT